MSWALKRQILYVIVLLLLIFIFGSLVIMPYFEREPTCTDGLHNGGETGVDCGGECARACSTDVEDMSILWTRAFEILPGRYNAVAYVVNHNRNTAIEKINYRFRFADEDNIYIGKRDGSTTVPPSGKFAIFEPAIDMGHAIPVYVTLEFTEAPNWTTAPTDTIDQLKVLLSNISLVDEDTSPVLSATIRNNSLLTIPDFNVVAILYDASGNALSASRTFIDVLGREEAREVSFTWPTPFTSKVVAKEIIPMYNIFSVKQR